MFKIKQIRHKLFTTLVLTAILGFVACTLPTGPTGEPSPTPTTTPLGSAKVLTAFAIVTPAAAVAYGSSKAATSSDGIAWTARTLPSSANWSSMTYGNGVFVAVGTDSNAATSP